MRSSAWTFLRFCLAGGVAFALYWAASTALVGWIGWSAPVAHVVAYVGCIGPAYLLQHGFAFNAVTTHAYSAPRYLAVQLANVVLGAGLSGLLVDRLGWTPLAAFFLVGALSCVLSYAVQALWTFRASPGSVADDGRR